MAHAIIRGANGRRHEVDFEGADDHGRNLVRRRDHGDRRRGAGRSGTFGQRRFALLNVPRELFNKALGELRADRRPSARDLGGGKVSRRWERRSPQPTRENLAGLVERVTFHNEDSGFCVLRVKARGQRDLITVVGHAAAIGAGEFVQASGRWVNDRTHGVQFRADFLRSAPPTTAEGIEKYLASGMIKGIGPIYAKKLVKAFRSRFSTSSRRTPNCKPSTASARSAPTASRSVGHRRQFARS